ncbi:site-specific DNA-methyltransferase [Pontibacter lucknowensis]|uniref:site-specific DNA-methyltransferase (adenine-specific) n=1 Tax=Pontibacter lucknowensis TaxID=1077936 RepID=A0A1N6YN56_9BACT|nr:site-specific DNA-methyltransferase [Pontibacter lucknowensis]SIR16035.1 adenine-specific DNA-methyltransferase [Pontibacter lucknowensis]
MNGDSNSISEDLLSKLKALIPAAFHGNKLDVAQLKQLLGEHIYTAPEAYQLTWAGKAEAYKQVQEPSTDTLIPVSDASVNWDKTKHVFIEGDNSKVLKVLQKAYSGKVKGIYIDPPYNTGSDSFIYADNFAGKNGRSQSDRRKNGHSNWLSMMLTRLSLARHLLREDGVIFVSIDDNELANLKLVMDEVFGEENFIDYFSWAKSETPANLSRKSKKVVEYVLCYQKNKNGEKFKGIRKNSTSSNGLLNQSNKPGILTFPADVVITRLKDGLLQKGSYGTDSYAIELLEDTEVKDGVFVKPVVLKAKFKWSQPKLDEEISKGTRISIPTIKLSPSYEKLVYDKEVPPNLINSKVGVGTNENASAQLEALFGAKVFDFPKPPSLIKYLLGFSDDPDGIFMDFFAGSGATAQAVLEMNQQDGGSRKYICVQLDEQIAPATKAYQLGFRTISEITRKRLLLLHEKMQGQEETEAIDTGFRYFKLAPSRFKTWRGENSNGANEHAKQLTLFKQVEKQKEHSEHMLWELLLRFGIPLTAAINKVPAGDTILYEVVEEGLLYGLDRINEEVLRKAIELKPKAFICPDSLFQLNEISRTNLQLTLQDIGIDFKSI